MITKCHLCHSTKGDSLYFTYSKIDTKTAPYLKLKIIFIFTWINAFLVPSTFWNELFIRSTILNLSNYFNHHMKIKEIISIKIYFWKKVINCVYNEPVTVGENIIGATKCELIMVLSNYSFYQYCYRSSNYCDCSL